MLRIIYSSAVFRETLCTVYLCSVLIDFPVGNRGLDVGDVIQATFD